MYRLAYNSRKGVALIIILAIVAAITVIGLALIVRSDTELVCSQNMQLKARIDCLADSGLEHAKGLIMYPHDIDNIENFTADPQQLTDENNYYDINIEKKSELDWKVKSRAYSKDSTGREVAESNLAAELRLDPAIALWAANSITLLSGVNIAGDVYCNGNLTNYSTINGDCFVDALLGSGSVTGSKKAKEKLQLTKPEITYAILTTSPDFTKQILDSYLNNTSYSGSDVYYINGDLTIGQNNNITGCVAVNGNLTVIDSNNIITAKKNIPALYVGGDLIMEQGSSLNCVGLVLVEGSISMCIDANLTITGSLFINSDTGGMQYTITVPDYSVNGYDGIMKGNCVISQGKFDEAIKLDGNTAFIDIGNPPDLNITDRITITAWIKIDNFNVPYQTVISKGNNAWRIERAGSTNYLQFVVCNEDGEYLFATGRTNVNDGQWHHIGAVYDSDSATGEFYLYVDGIQDGIGEASGGIRGNSALIYIGANADSTGRKFNGLIDDVRIYNTALSSTQIGSVKDNGSPTPGNLIGHWKMDLGDILISASPTKAAVYHWPDGINGPKQRWSPAAGAFYKSITRNP